MRTATPIPGPAEPSLLAHLPFAACAAALLALGATVAHCVTARDVAAGFQFLLFLCLGLAATKLVNPAHRTAYPYLLFLLAYSSAAVLIMAVGADAGDDDVSYFMRSKRFAQTFLRGSGAIEYGEVTYLGYVYLTGYLQTLNVLLGGASMEATKLVNAAAGGLVSVVVYHLAELVYGDRRLARWAGAAAAGFPLLLYYASILYRDIVLALLIVLAAYLWARLDLRRRSRRLATLASAGFAAGLLLAFFAIFHFRDLTVVLFVLGLLAMAFASLKGRAKVWALGAGVPFLVLVVPFIPLPSHGMSSVLDVALLKMAMYAELTGDRAGHSSLGARVLDLPMAYGWVPRVLYTLFFPIPPIVEISPANPLGAVGSLGAALNYFAVPFAVYGIWASRGMGRARILFWPALMMFVAIALTTINGRHKTQFLGMFVILAVYGWYRMGSRRWDLVAWFSLVLVAGACCYGALKLMVG